MSSFFTQPRAAVFATKRSKFQGLSPRTQKTVILCLEFEIADYPELTTAEPVEGRGGFGDCDFGFYPFNDAIPLRSLLSYSTAKRHRAHN
jgi:hypothetical protein